MVGIMVFIVFAALVIEDYTMINKMPVSGREWWQREPRGR